MAQRFRITIDTKVSNAINVHIGDKDGKVLAFEEMDTGLYVLNPNNTKDLVNNYSYLNIEPRHEELYTRREIQAAKDARKLYQHANMPGYDRFLKLVESNYFRDSPVTVQDVRRSLELYGREEAAIQGRATRRRPVPMQERQIISIPDGIKERHTDILVSIYYLCVQENHSRTRYREEVTSFVPWNRHIKGGQTKRTF